MANSWLSAANKHVYSSIQRRRHNRTTIDWRRAGKSTSKSQKNRSTHYAMAFEQTSRLLPLFKGYLLVPLESSYAPKQSRHGAAEQATEDLYPFRLLVKI